MSTSQRLVAVGVTILVVIGLAVVALQLAGAPIGQGSDPSESSSPSAVESAQPSATDSGSSAPSASPLTDAELLAILEEIEAQVEVIRGLSPADIGPPELIDRAQLRVELEAILEEEYPPEERERDNRFLRALGLIASDQDFADLQLQLLGDVVLGFYDDQEQRMVVVSDVGLDVGARITYAHEYTHALQDAAFGISSLDRDIEGEDDRSLARTTLIEGDATVAMLAWAFANLTQQELQEYATGVEVPDTAGIPSWMVDQVTFTYEVGLTWAGALAGTPFAPDFAAIDEAYADPPDSTEQVMDVTLEAWFDREEPVPVEAPDLTAILGDRWETVETTTIGQATIRIMLEYFGAPVGEAEVAAAGWGGDRVTVAYGPDDAFVAGWRLVWDSAPDAGEFAAAYESATENLGIAVRVLQPAEGEVIVLHASRDDLLGRVADALD